MSKKLWIATGLIAAVAAAGMLIAQPQKYPNIPDVPVVFENDYVVVQHLTLKEGEWTGNHSHHGNQMVVALDDLSTLNKIGDDEEELTYKKGDVFWIDKIEHDHKTIEGGVGVLITFKK